MVYIFNWNVFFPITFIISKFSFEALTHTESLHGYITVIMKMNIIFRILDKIRLFWYIIHHSLFTHIRTNTESLYLSYFSVEIVLIFGICICIWTKSKNLYLFDCKFEPTKYLFKYKYH